MDAPRQVQNALWGGPTYRPHGPPGSADGAASGPRVEQKPNTSNRLVLLRGGADGLPELQNELQR